MVKSPDFKKYAPRPYLLGAPVCRQIESIGAIHLMNKALNNKTVVVNAGNILYGPSIDNLSTTFAFYIQFDYLVNNSLILNSPKVPELSGMVTGTSKRNRVHRPYCGGAIPGQWHVADMTMDEKFERLQDQSRLNLTDCSSFAKLLMALFKINHLDTVVGESFFDNIEAYSKDLEKTGVLER